MARRTPGVGRPRRRRLCMSWPAAARRRSSRSTSPDRVVGQTGHLEVTAAAPSARFTALTITLEQNGRSVPLFTLLGAASRHRSRRSIRNRLRISRPIGKQSVPELQPGAARIVVTATRPSFLNLRTLSSSADERRSGAARAAARRGRVDAPLRQPRRLRDGRLPGDAARRRSRASASATSSTRASPRPAPASPGRIRRCKVAFFALLYDQDLNTPIAAFARDEAGNEAKATFVDNVFAKPFKRSRIELDDPFLSASCRRSSSTRPS